MYCRVYAIWILKLNFNLSKPIYSSASAVDATCIKLALLMLFKTLQMHYKHIEAEQGGARVRISNLSYFVVRFNVYVAVERFTNELHLIMITLSTFLTVIKQP